MNCKQVGRMTRIRALKARIKGLAAEGEALRREARHVKCRRRKTRTPVQPTSDKARQWRIGQRIAARAERARMPIESRKGRGEAAHRLRAEAQSVGSRARYAMLAYALLQGRSYDSVEPKVADANQVRPETLAQTLLPWLPRAEKADSGAMATAWLRGKDPAEAAA